MPPAAIQFLENHPAVATIDTFREVDLPMNGETVAVAVVRGSERRRLHFLRGDGKAIMRRFYDEPCVLVSESFARRHRVHDGDDLTLTTPEGARRFPIAGTFYDYTRDQGVVYHECENLCRPLEGGPREQRGGLFAECDGVERAHRRFPEEVQPAKGNS